MNIATGDAAVHPSETTGLSVVIPVRDGADLLDEQLAALAKQTPAGTWELVVVDDGSRDDPRAVLERYRDRLPKSRLIRLEQGRGAAHARNVGAEAADGERLAFLDADDVVAPGWLAAIEAALAEHTVVVSRFDGTRLNDAALAATRRLAQSEGLAPYRRPAFLPHAGGCGLALHKRVHEQIGGFDEALQRLEDTDYCWRLQLAGYELHFEPAAVVHIRFRAGASASFRQAFGYGRADGRLYHRYRPRGMAHLSLGTEALSVVDPLLALLKSSGADRPRRLRALGNRLGRLAGRVEGPLPSDRADRRPLRAWGARASRVRDGAIGRVAGTITGVADTKRMVALTFDDGPDPTGTPLILDVLQRHGVRATFFMVGSAAQRYPELVARASAEGHAIANHGHDHLSLPNLSPARRREQVERAARALEPYGIPLFRPPYGHQTFRSWWSVRRTGHDVVTWSAHCRDWRDLAPEVLAVRLREALRPGAIVLLHDGLAAREPGVDGDRAPLAEALDRVLAQVDDVTFVTLPELLASGRPRRRGWWKLPEKGWLRDLRPGWGGKAFGQ